MCIYRWAVEALYNFGSFLNGHGAIQADIQIPKGKSKDQNPRKKQFPGVRTIEGTKLTVLEAVYAEPEAPQTQREGQELGARFCPVGTPKRPRAIPLGEALLCSLPSGPAELLKEVQCLGVIGHQHYFITAAASGHRQNVIKDQHFTWEDELLAPNGQKFLLLISWP